MIAASVVFVFAFFLQAATGSAPELTPLAGKIVTSGAATVMAVQAIKSWFPKLGGWGAVALNVVGAMGMTYAQAEPGTPIASIGFLVQTALTSFLSHGAHSLIRKR